jgi:N utilization substance protein B
VTARKQGGRRAARREALFALYRWDLTGRPLAAQFDDDADQFARELADGVAVRAAELDRRIDEVSEGWPADRLGVLERNILRVGISELEGGTVPPEVAISEAVGLAKRYASEDAARLVNGILGRVAEERART